MDIKISVILPVYNVAAYIGDCIQSLRTQTLDGLEFIFVDDCSTDGTMRAVEAFAAEDSRVRIIRFRENQGPGAARNAGIEAAKGRYLSFVDPDDWIAPDFYARLYAKAESSQCDIIKGRTIGLSGSNGVKDPWWENMNRRMREKLSRNVPLFCAGCYDHFSALYSAALFSNGSVRYGLARKSEDLTFLLKASFHTDSIAFEDGAVYYYRPQPRCFRQSGSAMRWNRWRKKSIFSSERNGTITVISISPDAPRSLWTITVLLPACLWLPNPRTKRLRRKFFPSSAGFRNTKSCPRFQKNSTRC